MSKQIKRDPGHQARHDQVFNEAGQIVPVTVVQAGPCVVTGVRTPDRDGYSAVQFGYGEIDPRKVTKPSAACSRRPASPRAGTWPSCGPTRVGIRAGQELTAEVFASGQYVDVTGKSKGKGFGGRHEAARFQGPVVFARNSAQAPLTRFDRRCATPGRVFKGVRMGGPDGWRADHRAVPHRARRRRRARPAADQGRRARPAWPGSCWCAARPGARRLN